MKDHMDSRVPCNQQNMEKPKKGHLRQELPSRNERLRRRGTEAKPSGGMVGAGVGESFNIQAGQEANVRVRAQAQGTPREQHDREISTWLHGRRVDREQRSKREA